MSNQWRRREFLGRLSGAAVAAALAGCGGTGSTDLGGLGGQALNGSGSSSPAGLNLPAGGAGGGVAVQGTVNRAEIGGANLLIQTVQKFNGVVDGQGGFTAMVGGQVPQMVVVMENPNVSPQAEGLLTGPLRALSLFLPNNVMDVGAKSTALAIVFMTYGIMTSDPAEALRRIDRIEKTPSFDQLVSYFRSELPTKNLFQLASENRLGPLRDQVLNEYRAAESANRKLTPEEFVKQGGMYWERQSPTLGPEGPVHNYEFENHAFRFVTLIRHQVDRNGVETVKPTLTDLEGAARLPVKSFTGNTGVMGGANAISWGTLYAGTAFEAGGAVDSFRLHQNTEKVNYYVAGLGIGTQGNVPQSVRDFDVGTSALANTAFFYMFLPLVDLFSGGLAGEATFQLLKNGQLSDLAEVESLGRALIDFAKDPGMRNATISLVSGVNGDPRELAAFKAILVDLLVLAAGFFGTTAQTVTAEAIVGIAARAGIVIAAPWVAVGLGFLAVFLAVGGGLIGLINFGQVTAQLAALPAMGKLEIELERYELFNSGPRSSFLNVDGKGDVVYQHVLEPTGQPRIMESVLHRLEHGESPPSEQILMLQAFSEAAGFQFTTFCAANDQGMIVATRAAGGVEETVILHREGSTVQSTQVIATGTAATKIGEEGVSYRPTAINNLGEVTGALQITRLVDLGSGLPSVVSVGDAFLANGNTAPVRLHLREKLKAIYTFLEGEATIHRVFDINDAREVLFSFSYFQQVSGVALLDLGKNSLEILKEVQLARGEGDGIERFPTGYLSNSKKYRVFSEFSNGYTGHRQTVTAGKPIKHEAISLLVAGVAEDGTVGGFTVSDDKVIARVWYPGEGDKPGQFENKHATILSLAGNAQAHTRIASVGTNGHLVGTIEFPDGSFTDFGIRPAAASSNP